MPKIKMSYENMVIYKICCKDLEIKECYVGQTTNLVKRRWQHKSNCNNEKDVRYNFKVYQFIRANGGWDNWSVIEVDKCNCLNYEEALKIERKYIQDLNATLNKVIPSRTDKEYYNDNKEIIAEKQKEYYENNKQILAEKKKEYYYDNIEKKKEYREKNKEIIAEKYKQWRQTYNEIIAEKQKEYYENNKQILAKKKKEYRENNKELLYKNASEKVECECGCEIRRGDLARHTKSQKHIKLMETKI